MTATSPRSLAEAVDLLGAASAPQPIAGCTDLMVAATLARFRHAPVVDLLRVPELQGIVTSGDAVRIGATTTFAELSRHADVRRVLPSVTACASAIGGWQIQARATVGGNVANASPAGDSLPVWLALHATVHVAGPAGRRDIPYDDLHVGYRETALRPGEVIVHLHVPRPAAGTVLWFRKVGTRQALAISKVVLAGAVRMVDGTMTAVRLAAGSVAPTPVRLAHLEGFLAGRKPTAEVADEAGRVAAASADPIDDVRSTARYRAHVLGRTVRRLVLDLAERRA